ncbi:hypothetical protein HLA87_02465 [Mycoplasma miroungigenitalium]|uniref:Uncharacterized protein n=1 Tax=Mycoplasma miroungigenitalium TaxID=754515 RepID=A0A6M4JBJ5_9MOLU|nr:hypothetical protein [Mycoplasma miroungigenitalium]QJR43638.1 hypothetical protein HLA87_02465 [Mycoplasma miroungigenitalium]
MATGHVSLAIKLKAKNLSKDLERVQKKFKNSIDSIKTMLVAAKLGSFLIAGADGAIAEYMAKMRLMANLNEQGFGKEQSERLFELSDNFEKLGYNADTANDALTQFISTGKATSLQIIGIYLDKNTKSTLANVSAQERLNWVLSQGNNKLREQQRAMPKSIQTQIELRKAIDDTKKALGLSFMKVISNIVSAFGGLNNALKLAIVAFSAYKIATIVGNVGIGISKAIAQGGVFAAPLAFAMGLSALAGISALIGTAVVAGNAISGMNSLGASEVREGVDTPTVVNVDISEDRYGKEVHERSGNNNGRVSA